MSKKKFHSELFKFAVFPRYAAHVISAYIFFYSAVTIFFYIFAAE